MTRQHTEDRQLYNRTFPTSRAHRGVLVQAKRACAVQLVLSWLSSITFFERPSFLGLLTICISPIDQCALVLWGRAKRENYSMSQPTLPEEMKLTVESNR